MRGLPAFFLLVLVSGSAALAEVKVEKLGEDYYNLAWKGTTLEEILPDLYDQTGAQTFGLSTGAVKNVDVKGWLAMGSTAAPSVGHHWDRDSRQIGKVTVFFPFRLSALHSVRELVTARLAVSLTSAQMDAMSSEGGVAFSALTEEQKGMVRYLASSEAIRGFQFLEPELSKRLAESRVILSFHPMISFHYPSGTGGTSGSGFYLDSESEQALYRKWAPGQLEAGKMTTSALTGPGADVPGGATEYELRGIYTLADVIKLISRSSSGPVVMPKNARELKIMAYCKLSAAALARACATALGTSWRNDGGKWVLGSDDAAGVFSYYASSKAANDSWSEYRKLQSKLAPQARSGKCVYIADEPWTDQERFLDMFEKKPLLLSDLNEAQVAYLQKAWQQHVKAHKLQDKMPELPLLHMNWDPNLKLYIATENAVLYSEWLDYEWGTDSRSIGK